MKKEDLVLAAAFAITLSIVSILQISKSSSSIAIVFFVSIYAYPYFYESIPSLSGKNYLKNRITKLAYLSLILLTSSSNAQSPWQNILIDIICLTAVILIIDYPLRNSNNLSLSPTPQNDTSLRIGEFALLGSFAFLVSIVTLIELYLLPSIFTNYIPHGLAFWLIILMGNLILKTTTSYGKLIQCCLMTLIVGTTASISVHYTWSQIIAISGSLCLAILLIDFLLYKFKKPVGLSKTDSL